MRLLKKLFKILTSIVFNVLLPVIIVVVIVAFIDFTTLTISANVDVNSAIYKIRSNKSLFDLIEGFHNMISVMVTSNVVIIVCFKCLKIEKNLSLNRDFIDYQTFVEYEKENVSYSNETKVSHLRI